MVTYTQAALACPKIFLRWVGLSMIAVRRDSYSSLHAAKVLSAQGGAEVELATKLRPGRVLKYWFLWAPQAKKIKLIW